MKKNNVRKLPVLSKKDEIVGMIFEATIANAIRDAIAIPPRLLSPPVKAVLGNLGFVLQFAGVLLLVPAIVATILEDTTIATGIYLTTVLLLVTGFFLNSYGEKSSLTCSRHPSWSLQASFFCRFLEPCRTCTSFPTMTPAWRRLETRSFQALQGLPPEGISLFENPEELQQSFTFYRSYTQLVGA